MKKPKIVLEAEAVVATKVAALAAAKAAVDSLTVEYQEALDAVRSAQESFDAALPQCRLVKVGWRNGRTEECSRQVILRKTPGGMLVTCRVGDPARHENRFKWNDRAFIEVVKQRAWGYDSFELRDVPQEFMPARQEGAQR